MVKIKGEGGEKEQWDVIRMTVQIIIYIRSDPLGKKEDCLNQFQFYAYFHAIIILCERPES